MERGKEDKGSQMRKTKESKALENLVARLADLTSAVSDFVESRDGGASMLAETPRRRKRKHRVDSKSQIVEFFSNAGGRAYTGPQVCRRLRLTSVQAASKHLQELARDGLVQRVGRGQYIAAKSLAAGSGPNGAAG